MLRTLFHRLGTFLERSQTAGMLGREIRYSRWGVKHEILVTTRKVNARLIGHDLDLLSIISGSRAFNIRIAGHKYC